MYRVVVNMRHLARTVSRAVIRVFRDVVAVSTHVIPMHRGVTSAFQNARVVDLSSSARHPHAHAETGLRSADSLLGRTLMPKCRLGVARGDGATMVRGRANDQITGSPRKPPPVRPGGRRELSSAPAGLRSGCPYDPASARRVPFDLPVRSWRVERRWRMRWRVTSFYVVSFSPS